MKMVNLLLLLATQRFFWSYTASNITTRHPAYQELAAKIEKIKELAIMLADLEEDGENM